VEIDVCTGCDGLWFDCGELESYSTHPEAKGVSSTGSHRFIPTSADARRCPCCHTHSPKLGTIERLEAGLCDNCRGVWLSSKRPKKESIVGNVIVGACEGLPELAGLALEVAAMSFEDF